MSTLGPAGREVTTPAGRFTALEEVGQLRLDDAALKPFGLVGKMDCVEMLQVSFFSFFLFFF